MFDKAYTSATMDYDKNATLTSIKTRNVAVKCSNAMAKLQCFAASAKYFTPLYLSLSVIRRTSCISRF